MWHLFLIQQFQYIARVPYQENNTKNKVVSTSITKSMFSLMHKNRTYFENIGPNWSKLSTFVDKHHTLHVIDLIFDKMGGEGEVQSQ